MSEKVIVTKSKITNLADKVRAKAGTSIKYSIDAMADVVENLQTEFVTQEKTVTPTKSSQAITPDAGKDGLSKVTVNAIPNEYIIPSGSLNIAENGTHDVTDKASVVVNVPSVEPVYWDGNYTESDSKGYTLTLNCASDVLNNNAYTYSLDGGNTYNQFTSAIMTLENVSKIKFKETVTGYVINVGTTSNGYDVVSTPSGESEDIEITTDTTWYVSRGTESGGA